MCNEKNTRWHGGLEGVVCLMDDTLVFGRSQEEHDKRLLATLKTDSSCRAHAKRIEVYIQLNTPQVPWPYH